MHHHNKMKITSLTFCSLLLTISLLSAAPVGKYPSLPSKVLSNYKPKPVSDHSPEALSKSANTFLSSLNNELKAQAALPYKSKEKAKWTNVPPRGPQGGVRLGDLNETQIKKALDLLSTVLSEQGYNKAINIPLADDRLLRNGQRRPGFGAEDYWLAIFGDPSAKKPWGLQFDGHHIAINLAFHGNRMSMSPTFIGTQPREFQLGDNKIIPMALEAPSGLKLHNSLNDEQKKKATIGSKRANLIAAAGRDGFVPDQIGISCKGFNEAQRKALFDVIKVYIGDLPQPFLKNRIEELTAEIDKMSFAWWGPAKEKGDFSYRLQGPSLIIEYAGQDLGGDPHDHLHSMYRDPTNEYGARLGK
ncbi:MAG: hypothetical protein CMO45_03770 [Verrucomicrobiales bacterium]|nr:hypothetical protein [Verrucomicrobiales bacterium]